MTTADRLQAAINDAAADLARCTPKARRFVLTELRILAIALCEPGREDEQSAAAAAADLIEAINRAAPDVLQEGLNP